MMQYTQADAMQWTRLGMRKAFGGIIQSIASEHENIIVMAADISSSANLEGFAVDYPERFFNIGIAEQNMVGIAAGMAREGANVFIVSFAPFVALRAFEAIRTVIGYMHLNVKIIALASGLSLGTQGLSHYCIEDLALLRTIPEMKVLSPADCIEMAKCIEYLAEYDGPAYLRLTGIDGSPAVHRIDYTFDIGQYPVLREGNDIAILATGSIINECMRVARAIKRDGLECAAVDIHTVKPLAFESIVQLCQQVKLVVTVEEGTVIGGLGGAIAEYLAEKEIRPPLLRIGIKDVFPEAGNYAYILQKNGLSAPLMRDVIVKKYINLTKKEK